MSALFTRNTFVILGAVLIAELLTGLLVHFLILVPQTERISGVMARTVGVVSQTLTLVPEAERPRIIAQLSRGSALDIRPGNGPAPQGVGRPSYLEMKYMEALVRQLPDQNSVTWRSDASGRLWIYLKLAGEPYWLTAEAPRAFAPLNALIVALILTFLVAAAGGVLLQRRFDRPLRRLARAADQIGTANDPGRVPEEGPPEVLQVARSFNVMQQRLADADADRALMLAGISHDMRTPLARLRLALAMLPKGDAQLEQSVLRQVDEIEVTLGQFLDYARGVEGTPQLVDVAELVREAAEIHNLVPCGPHVPCPIIGHAGALRRAIQNLIVNAVRHGAPPIRVSAERAGDSIIVRVRDAGAGFDPADAARLVRPFVRGDESRSGVGAGLGLSIVDNIARAHHGFLRFTRGESFEAIITLPIDTGA